MGGMAVISTVIELTDNMSQKLNAITLSLEAAALAMERLDGRSIDIGAESPVRAVQMAAAEAEMASGRIKTAFFGGAAAMASEYSKAAEVVSAGLNGLRADAEKFSASAIQSFNAAGSALSMAFNKGAAEAVSAIGRISAAIRGVPPISISVKGTGGAIAAVSAIKERAAAPVQLSRASYSLEGAEISSVNRAGSNIRMGKSLEPEYIKGDTVFEDTVYENKYIRASNNTYNTGLAVGAEKRASLYPAERTGKERTGGYIYGKDEMQANKYMNNVNNYSYEHIIGEYTLKYYSDMVLPEKCIYETDGLRGISRTAYKDQSETVRQNIDEGDNLTILHQPETIRELSAREALNKYFNAEIKIDMVNNNSFADNGMDADGLVSRLREGLEEALYSVCGGI